MAGAPGTIWLDVGTRNRTLVLDNGDATRVLTPRSAMITDGANVLNVREIRLLRAASLRLPTPVGPTDNFVVTCNKLSGDLSGAVSLAGRDVRSVPHRSAVALVPDCGVYVYAPRCRCRCTSHSASRL